MSTWLAALASGGGKQQHRIIELLFTYASAANPVDPLRHFIGGQHHCIGNVPAHSTNPLFAYGTTEVATSSNSPSLLPRYIWRMICFPCASSFGQNVTIATTFLKSISRGPLFSVFTSLNGIIELDSPP